MRYIFIGYFSSFLARGVSEKGGGVLFPLFPSKISLCSHVLTAFSYVFPVYHICLLPSLTNIPLQRKLIEVWLLPHSVKPVLFPLFPTIFLLCSLVHQNLWETLSTDTLKTFKRINTVMATPWGCCERLSVLAITLFFFFFFFFFCQPS